MKFQRWYIGLLVMVCFLSASAIYALADKLTLKDGTVLEGKVIKQSDQYWVKTKDGESRIIPATDVASYVKTPASGSTPAPTPPLVKPNSSGTVKPGPKTTTPDKPAPNNPAPTPTPAPEVKPKPAPPAQVTVSVGATHTRANPVATGVKLTEGQQFILNPDPKDTWGKGVGPNKGKKCDYKGYPERPGWMGLECKVGGTGVEVAAGKPIEAPEAGEVVLACTDDTDASTNVGEIHVTIIGPLPAAFAYIQKQIDAVESASAAVEIINKYIASNPTEADTQKANEELKKWTEMAKGDAEKINGKWVSGDEHKALMEKVKGIMKEASEHARNNETLQAIRKLEEAQALYPNSFQINFWLATLAFNADDLDKALPLYERCAKIKKKSPESLANIAVIHFKKQQYDQAITEMQQAAEMGDNEFLAVDYYLITTTAPDEIKNGEKCKKAASEAKLLLAKYQVPLEMTKFIGMHPVPLIGAGGEGEPQPGDKSSGTGFVIDAEKGLILTNRHVAKGGKSYEVNLLGGEKVAGEAVVIDTDQDLAILKIKPPKSMKAIKFSAKDSPSDGADCTVIGFPLGDRYTANPKVTHGIVTSGKLNTEGADVLIDAKVNPGNSGGPILDKNGNLMAIVCMKSITNGTEDSYGMGISIGKIRKFLEKNNVKVETDSSNGPALSAEDIAAKIEPLTVMIVTTY